MISLNYILKSGITLSSWFLGLEKEIIVKISESNQGVGWGVEK